MTAGTVGLVLRYHSLTVHRDFREILAFDREGRLYTAFVDGRTYRRGLDNRLVRTVAVDGPPGARRRRRELQGQERDRFLGRVRGTVREVADQVARGGARVHRLEEPRGVLPDLDPGSWLERVLRWGPEELAADGLRFHQVYRPVSILPPDQYLATVVQLTEGCSWGRCTFCPFYHGTTFRIRPQAELEAHVAAVREFLGEGIALRRSVFLGDGNPLVVPRARLAEVFDFLSRAFWFPPFELRGRALRRWLRENPDAFAGIYSFVDIFTGHRRSVADYARLARAGLRRVYVGLETGSQELMTFLDKPGTPEAALEVIGSLRRAGVAVGVIVMAGIGGDRFAAEHVAKTVALVRAMELGPEDLVYLSPFVETEGLEYSRRAREAGIRPLDQAAIEAQLAELRAGIVAGNGTGALVSRYDIREFIY